MINIKSYYLLIIVIFIGGIILVPLQIVSPSTIPYQNTNLSNLPHSLTHYNKNVLTKSVTTNNFDLSNLTSNGWSFANSSRWTIIPSGMNINTPIAKNDTYMLESVYRSNIDGYVYDTAEYNKSYISNGSITAWVYTPDQFEITGIIIRAGHQNATACFTGINSSTICQGYGLQLYLSYAAIVKFTSVGEIILGTYLLPNNVLYNDQWWHLNLQANGTDIQAWISQNGTFTQTPQISAVDPSYLNGYTGLTSTTFNYYQGTDQYFSSIDIHAFGNNNPVKANAFTNKTDVLIATNGNWSYANEPRWSLAGSGTNGAPTTATGTYMLESTYRNTNGVSFETAENQAVVFANGSITSTVYSTNPYEFTGILLRGGTQSPTPCNTGIGSTTVCQGYFVYFYLDTVVLSEFTTNSDQVQLSTYTLPGSLNYDNQWWYMKLQANGSSLQAWVSQTPTFNSTPQLSAIDANYTLGYAGIVARTNGTPSTFQYYNTVRITNFADNTTYTSFNNTNVNVLNTTSDNWSYANDPRWTITGSGVNGVPTAINNTYMLESTYRSTVDGILLETTEYQGMTFSNGSITAAVYSTNAYEQTGILLRGGAQSSTPCNSGYGSTTLCQGYFLYFYLNTAILSKFTSVSYLHDLSDYILPGSLNFNNQWWYIRFQANGPNLQAWVSQTPTFTVNPQLSAVDANYTYGYAGIVARTSSSDTSTVQFYNNVLISATNTFFIHSDLITPIPVLPPPTYTTPSSSAITSILSTITIPSSPSLTFLFVLTGMVVITIWRQRYKKSK